MRVDREVRVADSTFGVGRPGLARPAGQRAQRGPARDISRQQPAIGELAAYVAPGGFLAAAVRTTTSALWRPTARQDWQAALAAFDEHDRALTEGRDMRYINEIGAPARADNLDALTTLATSHKTLTATSSTLSSYFQSTMSSIRAG